MIFEVHVMLRKFILTVYRYIFSGALTDLDQELSLVEAVDLVRVEAGRQAAQLGGQVGTGRRQRGPAAPRVPRAHGRERLLALGADVVLERVHLDLDAFVLALHLAGLAPVDDQDEQRGQHQEGGAGGDPRDHLAAQLEIREIIGRRCYLLWDSLVVGPLA